MHAFGPKGWFEARGLSTASLREVLRSSGALRRVPPDIEARVAAVYADPLRNRTFAFLEAVVGLRQALAAVDELARARVAIVGCGGIGSTIAYLLAGMGVRHLVLVDPDVVEESNLSRQILYTLADVGHPKIEALSSALRSRFRRTEFTLLPEDALSSGALVTLGDCDSVICAGDDPPTLAADLQQCIPEVPVWTCGYALGSSVVRSPAATGRAAGSSTVSWFSVPGGFAPSIGFQNMEIAAACVARLTLDFGHHPASDAGRKEDVYWLDYRKV